MSTFDELSKYYVRICKDKSRPPVQWIYSVDDAWFHPCDFKPQAHQLNEPVWQLQNGQDLNLQEALTILNSKSQTSTGKLKRTVLSTSGGPASAALSLAEKIPDAAVAELLVNFASEQNAYGICFCSFEYLWTNFATTINEFQNAILFDLNHQIAGILENPEKSDLKARWVENLKLLGVFDDNTVNDSKVYGWLLYFAIRFGRLGNVKCSVAPDHLLLVSSAIAGKAGGSEDAMTQFLQVQLSMWEKLSAKDVNLHDRRMTDFSFAPLPKVVTKSDPNANLLDTGLKIFNNTFSKAADWDTVRNYLLEDMILLWTNADEGHEAHNKFEHVKADLRCHGWIDALDNTTDNGLRGIHYCHDNGTELIAAKSIERFLKLAAPTCSNSAALPAECANWNLHTPTNPCLSFLIGIGDFISALSSMAGHTTYSKPSVTLENQTRNGAETLVVRIANPAAAQFLSTHKEQNFISDLSKATGAIQRAYRGAQAILPYVAVRPELSSNRTKDHTGMTRKAFLEAYCCGNLEDFIFFEPSGTCSDPDSILFVFYKVTN